ncbi:MAG: hypothetical protein GY929_19270 [Actinomycetia bacterium]|nr:hypothetical protein [Actinomycetes bacterium]
MGIRLDKPWTDLTRENIAALPAQMGVYHIADSEGTVGVIGYAGGQELFGMRSALERELEAATDGARYRYEFNHNYMSRYDELLMLHLADHGELPPANHAETARVGRLSPA